MDLPTVAFDLLHDGHRYFLSQAHQHCEYLVVAVNSDASVKRLKGDSRPYDSLSVRMYALKAFADSVIPFEGREEPLIMEIRPDVVFKGYDHSPNQIHYAARVPNWKNGPSGIWKCPVVHIARLDGYSTTQIAESRCKA